MKENLDIEIKTVQAVEVVKPKYQTLYYVAYWQNGFLMSSVPWQTKHEAEKHATQVTQYTNHVSIYKFDIEVPNLNNYKP